MMSSARLARPYARAAFDYACEHVQLDAWSTLLSQLSERIQHPLLVEILKNPEYSQTIRCEAVLALADPIPDQAGQNFINLLANQQRLSVIPDIYNQFEQLRAAIQKTLRIKVKSVVPLDETQSQKINTLLSKQFNRQIELDCEIDPSLLGGFVIYAGDRVIDSSVRGQLHRLREIVTK